MHLSPSSCSLEGGLSWAQQLTGPHTAFTSALFPLCPALACVPTLCASSWEPPLLPTLCPTRLCLLHLFFHRGIHMCDEKPHHICFLPCLYTGCLPSVLFHFLSCCSRPELPARARHLGNKQPNPRGQAWTELLGTASSSPGKADATFPWLGGQSHQLEAAACATQCQHRLFCPRQAGL